MRRLAIILALIVITHCTSAHAQAIAVADTAEVRVRESEPVLIDTLANVLRYPENAKRAGLEGKVTIRALIGRDGQVWRMNIVRSTNSLFEKPAVETMQKLHYRPAIRSGQPAQAWIEQDIIYQLH